MKLTAFQLGILHNLKRVEMEGDRGSTFYKELNRLGLVKGKPGTSYPGAATGVTYYRLTANGREAIE